MTKQERFFRRHFNTPGLVRLGIWVTTALGNAPVDAEVVRRADLPIGTTNFQYADALVSYANARGWSAKLQRLLREDLEEAWESEAVENGAMEKETYDYLKSHA